MLFAALQGFCSTTPLELQSNLQSTFLSEQHRSVICGMFPTFSTRALFTACLGLV